MDEFCANKDAQLKRCACSSRAGEFDDVRQQLATVDDKMLEFNQRLLTVNMDAEDAAALNQATEGELAFNQTKDQSDSKKMLDEISQKLNASFNNSNLDQTLGAISLSLDTSSAFDSLDSLSGVDMTTKSGVALYNAALPVCREMALEVCSEDELEIATGGYQMTIEQDCNTVLKSYQTQTDAARNQIRESSALLDMSRLDIYQQRNSDDTLTCRRKMLDMLTDNTVCGENMGKCLDITGQYIDPSTGGAILTENLADLATLITRPAADQTWTGAPGNDRFITFLNSKKKFLEPAMENCQDIADMVWDDFIEDALTQIKLAQDAKLEEVRQGCTTLTAQCLTDTADSLADFDARALSIFGVDADKTVKSMCTDVQNACTALLESTGGGGDDWVGGMTAITNDKTFETILQTCREVGRNCIIQTCKSISGNFGLCENIQTSVNRKAIINRTSCWAEVKECVASAGDTAIMDITAQITTTGTPSSETPIDADTGTFYEFLYGHDVIDGNDNASRCSTTPINQNNCVYDICELECTDKKSAQCATCRIAERIWGNCEVAPNTVLTSSGNHNKIKIPNTADGKPDTLLSWFAKNTGTQDIADSCRDTTCGIGYHAEYKNGSIACISDSNYTSEGAICATSYRINIGATTTANNCCSLPQDNGNTHAAGTIMSTTHGCCAGTAFPNNDVIKGLDWSAQNSSLGNDDEATYTPECWPTDTNLKGYKILQLIATINVSTDTEWLRAGTNYIICAHNESGLDAGVTGDESSATDTFPSGKRINCKGQYIILNRTPGGAMAVLDPFNAEPRYKNFYYTNATGHTCVLKYDAANKEYTWVNSNDNNPCINDGDTPASNWWIE